MARKGLALHEAAWGEAAPVLQMGGLYKLRRRAETHAFDAPLIHMLQEAVATDSFSTYRRYAETVRRGPPIALRDLLDFRGKGLSGATIVVRSAPSSNPVSQQNTIISNTLLYGATSGYLFAVGQAGERFAVRNSGATTVVEGCGSNGCEYMTGGTVVILGNVGDNFGAGFTGGQAFVYDPERKFELRVNPETVTWQRVATSHWSAALRRLITMHADETNSRYARMLLHDWDRVLPRFWQVVPKEYVRYLAHPLTEEADALTA